MIKLFFIIVVLCLQGCLPSHAQDKQICFKDHCFSVEIASDDESRMKGLQFRKEMPANHGMLFIFPFAAKYSFWMKDTLIPLDMIWLDSSYRIVYIAHNVPPCKTDPCPTYEPSKDALYVLELNAGLAESLHIREVDTAQIHIQPAI